MQKQTGSYMHPDNEAARKLAADILEQITSEPDTHNQTQWGSTNDPENHECKTVACVAGWAAILTNQVRYEYNEVYGNYSILPASCDSSSDIPSIGEKALGLDDFDAEMLFYDCTNFQAKEALGYMARGERIAWEDFFEDFEEYMEARG